MSLALTTLTALSLPKVGAATVRKLIPTRPSLGFESGASGDLDAFLEAVPMGTLRAAQARAEAIIEACDKHDVLVLSALDESYPRQLLDLPDFPVVLYVKGLVEGLHKALVAVVGTRNPSPVGERYAMRLARELALRGAGVVSGLALGIDAAAHEGALKADGLTIAVLAHGLDRVSPKSNSGLADRILESGGALVSEHEPGVPPFRAEYVRRNRIQSGLALASIIVESGEVGGAMHQARFTHDQKRLLYAFIPPESAPGSGAFQKGGAQRLVGELGASVISSMGDLDRAWAAVAH